MNISRIILRGLTAWVCLSVLMYTAFSIGNLTFDIKHWNSENPGIFAFAWFALFIATMAISTAIEIDTKK